MPTVFRYRGMRFFFYSNEGSPREPAHIHAESSGNEAKLWLFPEVEVAVNRGFDSRTLADLIQVVRVRRNEIERAWHEYFG